jgi:dTDP-4-dehydrorhamnose 3,5-epimerase
MKFVALPFAGPFLVELERREDDRGFFARAFCRREFEEHGLNHNLVQCNLSFNHKRATLRGMHYQLAPYQEVKLVRCFRGAIYDVIVDLRPSSPTFKQWLGVRLDEDNRAMLYVPEGFAHGYITLADSCEVFYQVSEFYHPESERGVRWNDPAFQIEWPLEPLIVSDKDRSYPDFRA